MYRKCKVNLFKNLVIFIVFIVSNVCANTAVTAVAAEATAKDLTTSNANPLRVLKINVFAPSNGKGLENDRKILRDVLLKMGHQVFERSYPEGEITKPVGAEENQKVDINIFFEFINAPWLSCATTNWFVSNPEWYRQTPQLLDKIDLFLCRTHEVERIFNSMDKKTYYMGFSSLDCAVKGIEKDYTSYLHVAGMSQMKGTNACIKSWLNDYSMPHATLLIRYDLLQQPSQENLTWITSRIPDDELHSLQNKCGVHLCPSETEGWGHHLVEAMSTGAVVITTNAPPMNEFITDKRCLVPYQSTSSVRLGTLYYVNPGRLKSTIKKILALPYDELKAIGANNRMKYEAITQEFQENLQKLINDYVLNA